MPDVLIVKNITREGPGLIQEVLEERAISFEVADLDIGHSWPDLEKYRAMIVLGGPDSANDANPKIQTEILKIREWTARDRPFLGICLGLQLLVKALGGEVLKSPVEETGFKDPEGRFFEISLTQEGRQDSLFRGLTGPFRVFQLHGETVRLIDGMTLLGTGKSCRHQVIRAGRCAYGIQCHFEVTREMLGDWAVRDPALRPLGQDLLCRLYDEGYRDYTRTGRKLISNFLDRIDFNGRRE